MKTKKTSLIMALIILVTSIFLKFNYTIVYADDEFQQPLLEGPSVEIDLNEYGSTTLKKNEKGNYSGQISVLSSSGITVIKCFMSGRTGGINGLYEIYINWSGTNQVSSIKARSLKITSTNILSSKTYYNKSFRVNGGSKVMGCNVLIPYIYHPL